MGNRLACDIGGTFTDVVLETAQKRFSAKVLTTPKAPEDGVLSAIAEVLAEASLDAEALNIVVHGTTLATNALIERKGARTAFLTTRGFTGLLDMGYEKRYDHYDLMIDPVPPIIPACDRFEITERLAADGRVIDPLDEEGLRALCRQLDGYEAVAIGFLHSYAHPLHERRAWEILREFLRPETAICRSSEICPEIREYERFVTTCANALIQPLIAGYLARLERGLAAMGSRCPLYLMTSGGGLTTVGQARRFPVRLVESGPAGGAILAGHVAKSHGERQALAFDMGGTTAKICLMSDGEPEGSRMMEVARSYRNLRGSGWPLRIPVIDLVEIGAGGGSIARVDKLLRITVGPDSTGADPGPVAYGLGGELPAVTDANLALGKISPEHFAGGKIALDQDAALSALGQQIGGPLGMNATWAAQGVVEIVEENMANAARVHAIEKGRDLSSCTMIAFGGAAPLHACALAEKLGIEKIIIPPGAGVGSAIGFLRAPVSFEVTRTSFQRLSGFDPAEANSLLAELEEEAANAVRPATGLTGSSVSRKASMRYAGQGHELEVALIKTPLTTSDAGRLRDDFEGLYERTYGVRLGDMEVEITAWSVRLQGPVSGTLPVGMGGEEKTPMTVREVFDPDLGQWREVPVYWRERLAADLVIEGPAIIAEVETSTMIAATFSARLDQQGYLILERRS